MKRWPMWRSAALAAAVACALLAITVLDDRALSGHMVQHLLLLDVAPLLALCGAPVMLALRLLSVPGRRRLIRALAKARPFTSPAICLGVFALVVIGTHLPPLYDLAVRHPVLHAAEHGAYLAAGLLMWWPLHDGDPSPRRRLGGLGRLIYLLAAMVPIDLVGAYLDRATSPVYAVYAHTAHAVADQQQAGAIMWVGGSVIMVAVGLWTAIGAMVDEERRQQSRDARVIT